MKNLTNLIAAAVLGSALTIGTIQLTGIGEKVVKIEHQSSIPAARTAYTLDKDGEIVPLDFTQAAEKVLPGVVHIRSTAEVSTNQSQIPEEFRRYFGPMLEERSMPRIGSGSGVIISEDGYIVTNNHVIDKASELEVTLHDSRKYKAEIIGTDESTDIALIKIDAENLTHIPFVDSRNTKVGEWVLAVGNPYNLNSTVTAGIISAKARSIGILDNRKNPGDRNESVESFIQTDAAVNPGNSGGALVNLEGGLIGINTAIASPTGSYSGYSFAVPSNIVNKVVEDLLKYGTVQRGWLGITIAPISEYNEDDKVEVNQGAYVMEIAENSGAREAGIQKGDVITRIDEVIVKSNADVIGYVSQKRPGDKVEVTVDRYGEEKIFTVLLKNRSGKAEIIKIDEFTARLGAEFEKADEELLKEMGLKNGVVVKKLQNGLIKNNTPIKEGFVITKIGNKVIKDVSDIKEVLENAQGGVLIEGRYKNSTKNDYYALGLS